MHGLRSNSALFWAPVKARVRHPLLIFSPPLPLGTPKSTQQFRPLVGPRESKGEVAIVILCPRLALGTSEKVRVT